MSDENFPADAPEQDPTEEVGPAQAEGTPQECEFRISELEENASKANISFLDEIQEGYEPQIINVGIGQDGLPIPDDNGPLETAAPFTYENMVCIEDARMYQEIFIEETAIAFNKEKDFYEGYLDNVYNMDIIPREISSIPLGKLLTLGSKYDELGKEKRRAYFTPDIVENLFGYNVSKQIIDGEWTSKYVPVKPIREQCRNYRRQMFINDEQPNEDEPGHKLMFRNCAARRTTGGAALSLRDDAIFACEWREPRDKASEDKYLNSFDNDKLQNEPHKVRLPLFNTEQK